MGLFGCGKIPDQGKIKLAQQEMKGIMVKIEKIELLLLNPQKLTGTENDYIPPKIIPLPQNLERNQKKGKKPKELSLLDTGVLDDDPYL